MCDPVWFEDSHAGVAKGEVGFRFLVCVPVVPSRRRARNRVVVSITDCNRKQLAVMETLRTISAAVARHPYGRDALAMLERSSEAVKDYIRRSPYGRVATDVDLTNEEHLDYEPESELRSRWHHLLSVVKRRNRTVAAVAVTLLMFALLLKATGSRQPHAHQPHAHQPSPPQPPAVTTLSKAASSIEPLKHRRGVQCIGGGAAAHEKSTCWTPQQMAAHVTTLGHCYFMAREPTSPEGNACVQNTHVCPKPLRLIAAPEYGVYSACADGDPMSAPVGSTHQNHDAATAAIAAAASHMVEEEEGAQHISGGGHQSTAHEPSHGRLLPSPAPPQHRRHPPPPLPPSPPPVPFVTVASNGKHFERNGKPYRFLGTTMWYAALLATRGEAGDRARLTRELDQLQQLGVNNVRILASSEGSADVPYHVVPAMQPNPSEYARDMLEGLDFVLKELSRRGMLAILVLNNGQPWSGGMTQYVAWATHTRSPFSMLDTDWDGYYRYLNNFFKLEEAQAMANAYARTLLGRRNSFTGVMYREDPTIMAWEIANMPRGPVITPEYQPWVRRMGQLIKSFDKHHLVALGSDGTGGLGPFRTDFDIPEVDYTTVHVWPEKYGWYAPQESGISRNGVPADTANAISRAKAFLTGKVQWSEQMRKPLVIEAFALSRDMASLDPSGATTQRDAFFRAMLDEADSYMNGGRGLSGISFWGWSGDGRPPSHTSDKLGWQEGDPLTGDPPSDPQGQFSVYASDGSTCSLIREYASKLNSPDMRA